MGSRGSVSLFSLCLYSALTGVIAGYPAEEKRKARQEYQ